MRKSMLLAIPAAVLLVSAATLAQDNPSNLEKLGQFKTTGASPNIRRSRKAAPKLRP